MPHSQQELETELLRLYQEGARRGYRAARFYQLFMPHCKKYIGGVCAVQQVLRHGKTGGLKFILKEGRPDLSVEALVLDPQWTHLFSAEDQKMAREKLTPVSK